MSPLPLRAFSSGGNLTIIRPSPLERTASKVRMVYTSLENVVAAFGFSDLHSYKDYIGFVKLCAPDDFPEREGVGPTEQWTLDLAFEGLRLGLRMAAEEKGEHPAFATGRKLVEDAYTDYREDRVRGGFFKLEELQKLLKKIRSA